MSKTVSSSSYSSGSSSGRYNSSIRTTIIPSNTHNHHHQKTRNNNTKPSTQYPPPGYCNYGGCGQFNGGGGGGGGGCWPFQPCYDPCTGQIAYTYNHGQLKPQTTCAPYMLPYPLCQPPTNTTKCQQKGQNKKIESSSSSSSDSSSDSSTSSSESDSEDSSSSSTTPTDYKYDKSKGTTISSTATYFSATKNTESIVLSSMTEEISEGTYTTSSSSNTGSTTTSSDSGKKKKRNGPRICPCPPQNLMAPIQNACLGMYPQTTNAMEARYTKLPPEWPPRNRTLSFAPEDEEGLNFKFKPRSDFATEVTFTIEPKKRPMWQTMMACGFRPMITTSAPPFALPPNYQQHNQQHNQSQSCDRPKDSKSKVSTAKPARTVTNTNTNASSSKINESNSSFSSSSKTHSKSSATGNGKTRRYSSGSSYIHDSGTNSSTTSSPSPLNSGSAYHPSSSKYQNNSNDKITLLKI